MAGPLLPRALRAAGPSRLLARGAAGRAGPADPALQEVERVLQQQRKAVRLRRLRRELEPAGPPQRSLSWQAMEQIRYLRQAFPEEWPVARLAQGFGVSPDVIQRVLRSKFSPPLERRMKQDAKVLGVARILSREAGVTDIAVLQAALLHDTVEDTDTTFSEIEEQFGGEVRRIVEEVTDDKMLPKMERKRLQIERAAHSSRGARLVKLADKLYNLRDLNRSTPCRVW
ncbi:neugrin [Caretta caretta]|uniref:neugrin n=1 Tax=Caretta caretta TaxID=8467 RepID=UPI003F4BD8D1